jgi:hypothetical protein
MNPVVFLIPYRFVGNSSNADKVNCERHPPTSALKR